MRDRIEKFLSSPAFGVAGASSNRQKYGNKVLRCYIQNNKKAYPIHPTENEVEGVPCFKTVAELPDDVQSISIITPPKITEKLVDEIIRKGIQNVWMQPGAESDLAISKCNKNNINVISGGACVLIELGFKAEDF